MPGLATGVVSYLGDICGTSGDIQDAAHVDVLFITLCSTDSSEKLQHIRMNQIFANSCSGNATQYTFLCPIIADGAFGGEVD